MADSKDRQKRRMQKTAEQSNPMHVPFLRRYAKLLISLFLIAATVLVFWPVKNHEFLNYDDNEYVTENPQVKSGLTLKGFVWAFTTTHAANWHPLTWLSHMMDYEFYGLAPGGHHLTSVLFHVANALLLFFVLQRMTKTLWVSGFVAALFAFHPLHVESVAWVAERKDVLSTFFWMLTLWAYVYYVEGPGLGRYSLVISFFVLGLLAKPMVGTLPFVLLLIDYWPLRRFRFGLSEDGMNSKSYSEMDSHKQTSAALRLFLEKIPLFVLAAASSLITYLAQQKGGGVKSIETFPLATRVVNALVSYASYIRKMVWPEGMAFFYPYPETFPLWEVLGSTLVLSCISILVVRYARKHPFLLVGWFWYIGTLVPVIGLIQVGNQAMADRYTYIPLVGLFIMVGMGFPCLLEKWPYRKVLLGVATGLALFLLMVTTRLQINHWQNNFVVFEHALRVTSDNFLAHNNLGVVLAEHGKIEEAIAHFREAIRIKPNYLGAHYNLGVNLMKQGRHEEAMDHYREALRIDPHDAETHNKVGILLAREGKQPEALNHFTEALRFKPDFAAARYNLGLALAEQGEYQKALPHFAEALRLNPDFPEAHFSLGMTYRIVGDWASAMEEYRILKRINPELANILHGKLYR
ncbi:MAG TPA: tetratricopeptide repeat protein [Thermodesulfobacteriota bacterium]|nr:tetratricopeptide repeat protein [Thermodesulfobacteriota bacterium]